MMKKLSYIVTLTAIAAMMLIGSAAASSQQEHSGMAPSSKPPQGKMSKDKQGMGMMDMSPMKQEPHHLLAKAYKDNLVNFAKALHQVASQTKPIDPEFARAAVAEMRRSFDQMQQHHQAHMKTMDNMKAMDDKMTAQKADMMKKMDAHQAAIQEHLTALEKEVQAAAPVAKAISEHVAELLKQCEGMSKMHGHTMGHKMAGPKDKKMSGPKDHKMN